MSATYLNSYLRHAEAGGFLPSNRDEVNILINIYLFEKALFELGYELNNRPEWVRIPLVGIRKLVDDLQSSS